VIRRRTPRQRPDDSITRVDGPWQHRTVRANGIALHVAELGEGPLVLFLHGFPFFWWTWREQLVAVAEAGFRAVAVDLRGYGTSDKPPRGYDTSTLAADIAGLVGALGERDALLVGTDVGAELAWTVAVSSPHAVRGLVIVGGAHPLRLRAAVLREPRGQARAYAHALGLFQLPRVPERRLTDNGDYLPELIGRWSGPAWRRSREFSDAVERYVRAMQVRPVAHCALEHFRWLVRSVPRGDGRRYAAMMAEPVAVPVLQLHGALDTCILPRTAEGSIRHVSGSFEWKLLDGIGHFPQEEVPVEVSQETIRWAHHTA
jgi:pimeloyl-ACP methyl ester carboxylesterase